jgi:hypothetical protein
LNAVSGTWHLAAPEEDIGQLAILEDPRRII